MLYKRTEIGILLIAEFDGCRINTANTIFEFNDPINLPDLTAWMTSTKRACIDNITPLFPTMKISKFALYFTKARWELDIHF